MIKKSQRTLSLTFILVILSAILLGCSANVEPGLDAINSSDVNQIIDQIPESILEEVDQAQGDSAEIVDQALTQATPMVMTETDNPDEPEVFEPEEIDEPENAADIEIETANGDVFQMTDEDGKALEAEMAGAPPAKEIEITDPTSLAADNSEFEVFDPSMWLMHINQDYGFSFQYPPNFVEVPAGPKLNKFQPLAVVLIQDKQFVDSNQATLEPYRLSVMVYPRGEFQAPIEWLQASRPEMNNDFFEFEDISIGGSSAVKACSILDFAPNCFIFVSHGNYIYEIVPYGELSSEMMNNFRFFG